MHAVLLCINHTKGLKWLLHYTACMTLTLKQGDLAFVGKKSIPVPAGKKEHYQGEHSISTSQSC